VGNRLAVYLAARVSRLRELQDYKSELEAEGIEVTSRWLLGRHEWEGTPGDAIPPEHAARFASAEDMEDITRSHVVVCFTEAPGSGPTRGSCDWKSGYALGLGKPQIFVGHRENVFHCLPSMSCVETWEEAVQLLMGAR
jgi:hypothetical protein